MPAQRLRLLIGSDHFIRLTGLQAKLTAAPQNAATVTATIYDRTGAMVEGLESITLNYIALSSGDYRGSIPDNFPAPAGASYSIRLVAEQSGLKRTWKNPLTIEYDSLPAV